MSFHRWGIYPGYRGVVTEIEGHGISVDGKEFLNWADFRPANEVTEEEAARLRAEWEASFDGKG